MKNLSILVSLLLLFTLGCSGGGDGRSLGGGGLYCDIGQTQSLAPKPTAEKLSLKPEDIEPGKYIFISADVLYVRQKGIANDRLWHILRNRQIYVNAKTGSSLSDDQVQSGEIEMKLDDRSFCVRGIQRETPSYSVTTEGLVSMTVTESKEITAEARRFKFDWIQDGYKLEIGHEIIEETYSSPQEIYEGKTIQYDIYKIPPVPGQPDINYEVISKEILEDGSEVTLRVHLRRI